MLEGGLQWIQEQVRLVPYTPGWVACNFPLLNWQPVEFHQGRFDMIHTTCPGDHSCRDVLALLKLGHRGTRQTSKQGRVHVQARCNEGMDNFLARGAVEESLDLFNVADMVAGRLRQRVYAGVMVMCVSKTAPKTLTAVIGTINDSPKVQPGRAIFDICCRDPIRSTTVLSSFSFRTFIRIRVRMSLQQLSSISMSPSTLGWTGFTTTL